MRPQCCLIITQDELNSKKNNTRRFAGNVQLTTTDRAKKETGVDIDRSQSHFDLYLRNLTVKQARLDRYVMYPTPTFSELLIQ